MTEASQPALGAISSDGQFEWNGSDWVARGSRRASRWSRPMQVAAAAYLVVLAVTTLSVNFVLGGASAARIRQAYLQVGMDATQAERLAQTMSGVVLTAAVVFAVVYLVLALASWRGSRWAFWADSVVLLQGGFSAFANLSGLRNPAPATLLSEAVSLTAVALLLWFVASWFRFGFGPWATLRR
jgi:hypothetical protein